MPKRRAFAMLSAILALCLTAQFAPLSALGEAQPTVIPLSELAAEYRADSYDTNKKYGGMLIETTGAFIATVVSSRKTEVRLKGDVYDISCSLICELDEASFAIAETLTEGQYVTVRGYYDSGYDCPELTKAQIVDVRTGTETTYDGEFALDVSLKELAAAYDDNALAVDQRYGGKRLRVTGYFTRAFSNLSGYTISLSATTDLWSDISCELGDEDLNAASQLSSGQTVSVIGTYEGGPLMPRLTYARIVDALPAPTPEPTPEPQAQAVCTMEEFERIQIGMSYDDVVEIFGGTEQLNFSGADYFAPLWPNQADTGFSMIILDGNFIVTNKLQHGLD